MSTGSQTQLFDISRQLVAGHPNWPGDAPFHLHAGARISGGETVNTGVISTSTHTGTHVDAPWHYDSGGARLHQIPLEIYVGEALVVRVRGAEAGQNFPIGLEALGELPQTLPPRVLLATGQPAHWKEFPTQFAYPTPELVRALAGRGVRLLGLDVPSMDPLDSKTLEAHHAAGAAGMHNIESLNLAEVPAGRYTLVCLPLPLVDADGAPARAILLP